MWRYTLSVRERAMEVRASDRRSRASGLSLRRCRDTLCRWCKLLNYRADGFARHVTNTTQALHKRGHRFRNEHEVRDG